MASLAEENAKHVFDFLHLLSKEHPHENIVFSPVNLSAALSFLHYGSQHDKKVVTEKVLHLNKTKENTSAETRCLSKTSTREHTFGSKKSTYLPKLPSAQAVQNKASYRDSSLFTTSGENERQTTDGSLSAAETIPQADVEEGVSLHYIPWRKHLLGMEESENLIEEKPSPVEKVSRNQATAHKNAHKSLTEASPPMASSQAEEATEDMSTLLHEFRNTVKCADDNAQAFKESWVLFKECCDNMCTSMSNLQGVLETLITILRE